MIVGFKLYREVRDFAPSDWDSGQLVVAWVIADDASDITRRSWIELPLLCARARMGASGVRGALGRLAAGGYEFRMIHGHGRDGRPVFAARGHSVDYLIPDMITLPTIPGPVENQPAAAVDNPGKVTAQSRLPPGKGDTTARKGDTTAAPIARKGDTTVSPLSSVRTTSDTSHVLTAITPSVEVPGLIHRHPAGMTSIEAAAWHATHPNGAP